MKELRIVSGMIDENHLGIILPQLRKVFDNAIPGDVVELGCNVGTTSLFIQREIAGRKPFHVYDSFQGLPDKHEFDQSWAQGVPFEKGGCPSTIEQFVKNFVEFELNIPEIHVGWFSEMEYPERISFAFFDGDFYTSIMDSWKAVYPRLSPGAIVCIHDYDYDILPGVKKACDDFLFDKPEAGTIIFSDYVGVFTKQ